MATIRHVVGRGQNWTDIAHQHYQNWRLYRRILYYPANAGFADRETHHDTRTTGGREPVSLPLLRVGDVVYVPELPAGGDAAAERGEAIRKSARGRVTSQSPAPRIEVFYGKNGGYGAEPDLEILPQRRADAHLLRYTFSEGVGDLDGSFSFDLEGDTLTVGGAEVTVYDAVPLRSVVKIHEGGKDEYGRPQAAFVGIVRRRQFSARMGQQGVSRAITFSGKSAASLVSEFTVSLDPRIPLVRNALAQNADLIVGLNGEPGSLPERQPIAEFMRITHDFFKQLSQDTARQIGGVTNWLAGAAIERFMGAAPADFIAVSGARKETWHPIAMPFINESTNTLAGMWRHLLPSPAYELFTRCDAGRPKIHARMAPFEAGDWAGLPLYVIAPEWLTAYDAAQTDEDVYTAFFATVIGAVRSAQFFSMLQAGMSDGNGAVAVDAGKAALYGWRPLEVDFFGCHRGSADDPAEERGGPLNRLLKSWFSRLDEMHSGSVTVIKDFEEPQTNPRAGRRFWAGSFT